MVDGETDDASEFSMDQPLKSPRELRSTKETGNRHSFSLEFDNQTRAVCKVVSQASIQDDRQGNGAMETVAGQ